MNRRNLLLGTAGLAVGITGCSNSSKGSSQVSAEKISLNDCPALKAYIDSLCDIPAGTFKMGSNEYDNEAPVHKVPISVFRMGKTPVTVAMWEEYVSHTSESMPPEPDPSFEGAQKFNIGWNDKDHPMVNVNWDECNTYARWASEISGVILTLPSESRWEYACRGGREGLKYTWGNDFDRSKLWCSDEKYGDRGSTGSVNRRVYVWRDHPWGLVDMIGNVWEWCLDWYDPKWYTIPQASERDVVNLDASPLVEVKHKNSTETKPARSVRGGSWNNKEPERFRCAERSWYFPGLRNSSLGFRLSAGPT